MSPDNREARQREEDGVAHDYLRKELKRAVIEALDDKRALDAVTHAKHHEYLANEIEKQETRLKARAHRARILERVATAAAVPAVGIFAAWLWHIVTEFFTKHFTL